VTSTLLTLVLPFALNTTQALPTPQLLIRVNGERIVVDSTNTIQLKTSDHLLVMDTLTAIAAETYAYELTSRGFDRAASYSDLKAGTYFLQFYRCTDGLPALPQPLQIVVKSDHTWWYIPAFVLYLVLLTGGATYAITVNRLRASSKIDKMRKQWTDRLHTNLGGDLLGAFGRVALAQQDLQSLQFSVQNNLAKARAILGGMERKLRFVFDLIDPTKNSVQTVLNNLHWHAQECFSMKNIALDYQNHLPENAVLKIDLARMEKLDLIVTECVNNIYKHAEATQASIHIRREGKALWFRICDNGKGFDWQAKLNEPCNGDGNGNGGRIGLKSLFTLAKEGLMDLKMQSAPGEGTCVTITVPEL
jgi:anti-sigma regulatory factor (Ser/Thr protein kinase)